MCSSDLWRPVLQRRLGRRAGGPEPAEALRQHHPPVHEAIGDGGRQLTADRRQGAGLLIELGLAAEDGPVTEQIRDQAYRGSRYSFGYPACPDLELRRPLCGLLKPERIGVVLSEELQLHPEQSTDALIVHHREARYFNAR